jgi:hypothetical protein
MGERAKSWGGEAEAREETLGYIRNFLNWKIDLKSSETLIWYRNL